VLFADGRVGVPDSYATGETHLIVAMSSHLMVFVFYAEVPCIGTARISEIGKEIRKLSKELQKLILSTTTLRRQIMDLVIFQFSSQTPVSPSKFEIRKSN
jgi:hypothetical protein